MRRAAAILITTLMLVPAGPVQTALARSMTDDGGRVVTAPDKVERVFAAGPPAAILLYTLAPDLLLGWPRENRAREKAFLAEPYASLPATGRIAGRGSSAGPESVLALKPDLILDVGATRGSFVDSADRTQQQTGIPYILLDGRYAAIPRTYRTLGALLGRADKAEELAGWAEAMLADIDRRLSTLPPDRRPRVYYGRGPDGLQTGLAGSINLEVLDRVGAVNAAAGAGAGGLAEVSLEQVLAWDPDVILTIDPNFHRRLGSDPRWRVLRAVREGRVYLSPRLPFGWVDFPPGVNRLIGARWLVSVLYPDLFPEDIRPIVRDFYQRFYHVTLSDARIGALLTVAEAGEVDP